MKESKNMDTLFQFIDASEDLAIELERELTSRPAVSPESGGEGELDKCLFLERWLQEHGIENLQRYDAPDPRASGGVRPNLVATIAGSGTGGGRLWIMSHLDVVPPGEASLWDSDPWTLVVKEDASGEKRVIGRGVEDNQQGLVSSVLAALAFVKNNIPPETTIKLLFVADEENGSGFGIDWLLANHSSLFHQDDMVLIPDGGDREGETIQIAEKNLVWLKLRVKGKQAHGSTPDKGINAHLAAADLALHLHYVLGETFAAQDPLFEPPYSTFEPTKKEANVPNVNTIPGEDVFYMDMRILPRYSNAEVSAEINRITHNVETEYGVTIETEYVQKHESKPTPPDSPAVKLLTKTIAEVYGLEARLIGIGGGTVAASLRNVGIDSVVWSRLGDCAHQPNEYTFVKDILGNAKVMAALARQ
jgi:succinyl-diaminopimelate desuccinylase